MSKVDDWKSKRIDEDGMFTPARMSALQTAHPEVETLGDLEKLTLIDLLRIPNFGRKTINLVRERLLSEQHWATQPSDEERAATRAGFPADIWEAAEKVFAHTFYPGPEAVARALLTERERSVEALQTERERCAKIAEVSDDWRGPKEIAAAIRQWEE